MLLNKKWPKATSLKKARESTEDGDRPPMTIVYPDENTRLHTFCIKNEVAEGHFSKEDKRINR